MGVLGPRSVGAALAAAVLTAGCVTPAEILLIPGRPSKRAELRTSLVEFASTFSAVVSAAGDQIVERADALGDANVQELRRRTLVWKVRMIPLIRDAALREDPGKAFVSALLLTVAMRDYLADGEGRAIFEPYQALAIKAAAEVHTGVYAIGETFLRSSQMERIVAEVGERAHRFPIRGKDFHVQTVQLTVSEVGASDPFRWLLDLVPVSDPVSSGAASITEFNKTAQHFARIIAGLPEQARWEADLALYDLEEHESVLSLRTSVEGLAATADLLSLRIDRWPVDLGLVIDDALGGVDALSQSTAARIGLETEAAIDHFETAAQAAIDRVDVATHGALDRVDAGAQQTVERLDASVAAAIDQAAWRVFLLMLAFFGLLLVYRLLARWIGRSPERE